MPAWIKYEGGPPAHLAVGDAAERPRWVWFGRFARIPEWRPQDERLPVRAVKVTSFMEGDAVRIRVSVLLGDFHEKEKPVAAFLAREGEKVYVSKLAPLGVVPFEIAVVRLHKRGYVEPEIENRVPSIEVLGIRPQEDGPYPSGFLLLRNLSTEGVIGLEVAVYGSRDTPLLGRQHRVKDSFLIGPGEVLEYLVSAGGMGDATPEGFRPDTMCRVVVRTALFRDDSHEGDSETGLQMRLRFGGQRDQVARALQLLRQAQTTGDPAAIIGSLKKKAEALPTEDVAAGRRMAEEFTGSTPPGYPVDLFYFFGLRDVRDDLLKRLTEAEKSLKAGEPGNLSSPLVETIGAYEAWLARLP